MRLISIFLVVAGLSSLFPRLSANTPQREHPPLARDSKGLAKSATLVQRTNFREESRKPSEPLKGPDWIETNQTRDHDTWNAIVLNSSNGKFSLRLAESPSNEGDVTAYAVSLVWKGQEKSPVPLGISTGATISPDSRYVMLEPLKLIDVEAWEIYELSKVFKIKEGYFAVDRWTKDGKKILVHVVQCPYDCPAEEPIEYWLIELQ